MITEKTYLAAEKEISELLADGGFDTNKKRLSELYKIVESYLAGFEYSLGL